MSSAWKQLVRALSSHAEGLGLRNPAATDLSSSTGSVCLVWFVCLFVLGDTLHSRILHSYGDVTITGEGLQILNYIAPLPKLDNRCDCHGSSEITIINECPMSQ